MTHEILPPPYKSELPTLPRMRTKSATWRAIEATAVETVRPPAKEKR
jgi:hypothetical protein